MSNQQTTTKTAVSPAKIARQEQRRHQREQRHERRRRAFSPAVLARRGLALLILVGVVVGLWWLVTGTGVLDPLLAAVGPIERAIAWAREDPARLWGAAAMIIVPYIGIYYTFFENEKR